VYMEVEHGKQRKPVYLGAYVPTKFWETGLVRSTKAIG
jgi:hypothetical protein